MQPEESGPRAENIRLRDFVDDIIASPTRVADEDFRKFQDLLTEVENRNTRALLIGSLSNLEGKNALHVMVEHNLIQHLQLAVSEFGWNVESMLKKTDIRNQTPLHLAASSHLNKMELVKCIANSVSSSTFVSLLDMRNISGRSVWDILTTESLIEIGINGASNREDLINAIIQKKPLQTKDIEKLFLYQNLRRCIVPRNQSESKSHALVLWHTLGPDSRFKSDMLCTTLEAAKMTCYLCAIDASDIGNTIADYLTSIKNSCALLTVWILAENSEQTSDVMGKLVDELRGVRELTPMILLVQSSAESVKERIKVTGGSIGDFERPWVKLYYVDDNDAQDFDQTLLGATAKKLKDARGDKELEEMIKDVLRQHYSGKPTREFGSFLPSLKPECYTENQAHNLDHDINNDAVAFGEPREVVNYDLCSGEWIREGELGSGRYGTVFKYGRINSEKKIAVKLYHQSKSRRISDQGKEIQRSIQALLTCKSKYIVKFHGYEESTLSLIMEYMPGLSIRNMIDERTNKSLEPDRARLYTTQILDGLTFLHEKNYCHRDVKCSNVLLDMTGMSAKLSDFDTAKWFEKLKDGAYRQSIQTNTGKIGTFLWTAPEVLNKCLEKPSEYRYGLRADIWSVGATLYEMLTGSPPLSNMDDGEAAKTLWEYEDSNFEVLVNKDLVTSEGAYKFLKRMFVKDYKEKRPSAADLKNDVWLSNRYIAPAIRSNEETTGPTVSQQPEDIKLDDSLYIYEEFIGNGSFGDVHRFTNETGERIAVKTLQLNKAMEPGAMEIFQAEINMMKDMGEHDNIVAFKGYVNEPTPNGNQLRLCMEYILGDNLTKFSEGNLSEGSIKKYSRNILSGLEFLHRNQPYPIIHRDLNSGNVLHDTMNDIMKITDFGLSKYQKLPRHDGDSWHWHTGMRGTIPFMAPEVVKDYGGMEKNRYGRRVDIWSFGVLLVVLKTSCWDLHDLDEEAHLSLMQSYKDRDFDKLTRLQSGDFDDETREFLKMVFAERTHRKQAHELLEQPWLI